jgi:Protein of unknown function (DUF3007)
MKTTLAGGGLRAHGALTRLLAIFVVVAVVATICAPSSSRTEPSVVVEAFAAVARSSSTRRIASTTPTVNRGSFPLELLSNNKKGPTTKSLTTSLFAVEQGSSEEKNNKSLKFLLDPGTKGGAVFLSLLLFLVPIVAYNVIITINTDIDPLDAGKWIGAGFTILATLAWVSTYIFRVATKDMTYVSLYVSVVHFLLPGLKKKKTVRTIYGAIIYCTLCVILT